MLRLTRCLIALSLGLMCAGTVAAPSLQEGSVIEAAERLQAGEFLWAPEVAPEGPVLLVVSLATQRAVLYRNGVPVAISTVSTGRPGYRTPTGIFTVLQREVEHYSNLYDDAPMPYMQRLTWGGVALHGGSLPGYPASHGCIRLPHEFAKRLYGVTRLGMTVVVTNEAALPRLAPAQLLIGDRAIPAAGSSTTRWAPEASPKGPVSIVISAADNRIVVLRNGIVIGDSPARVDVRMQATTAFLLRSVDARGRSWDRIVLPGQRVDANTDLRDRVHVPEPFRGQLETVLAPGATVVVTPDSLKIDKAPRTLVESGDRG